MTLAELVDAYNTSVVTQDTFLWTDGMEDWRPLAEVEPVVAALHAHAEQEAAASSVGSGYAGGQAVAAAAPEASYAPSAAAPYEAPAAAYAASAAARTAP